MVKQAPPKMILSLAMSLISLLLAITAVRASALTLLIAAAALLTRIAIHLIFAARTRTT